jgi:ribose transport system permease protein
MINNSGQSILAASRSNVTARLQGIRLTATLSLLVIFALICAVFGSISPAFFSGDNVLNIAQTLAVVGITSIGMTMVLISGGVDISVGSAAALSGVLTGIFWTNKLLPIWPSALLGLLSGAVIGFVNSLAVTRLKINSLIATLGVYSIVRGLAFVLTGGSTNQLNNPEFQFLGRGAISGIPFSLILMLILYGVSIFVLQNTAFGRNLYAIGGSQEASRLAGIDVNAHLTVAYVLCGLLAALAGLITTSQLAVSAPGTATGLEFTVIAAVILGGTSLSGGKGTLFGSLVGVLILRTLDNGLVLANVNSYYQEVARGLVLLLAVGFDQIRLRLGRKGTRGI